MTQLLVLHGIESLVPKMLYKTVRFYQNYARIRTQMTGPLRCVCVCGYNKEHKEHNNRNYNEAKATNQKRNDQRPHNHQ
jgi:hypothetical protein